VTETGKPVLFNIDVYCALIEMYIQSDEVEKALWLLNNPPSYFQDHEPKKVTEIRNSLHRQLWTPVQYKGIYDNAEINQSFWPLRAKVLEELCFAQEGLPLHIMELAPGDQWLKAGLEQKGLQFTYESISLDGCQFSEMKPGSKTIFVAFELIEHLSNPWEIYQNYLKFNKQADYVLISTPLYSYGGGCAEDWRTRPLGHLRTYGPRHLHEIVNTMFQGFRWTCNHDNVIVLTGERIAT
jgi:hypothetical protein